VSFIGLLLIAIGTGSIKPCIPPYGAEQFTLPEQESQMRSYFFWFYAAINVASVVSYFLSPVLRSIPCLGQKSCFPLAFGVPAVIMLASLCKPCCGILI